MSDGIDFTNGDDTAEYLEIKGAPMPEGITVDSDKSLLGVLSPLVPARATITTGGMKAGDAVLADPASPFVQQCFEHGWLVPRGGAASKPDEHSSYAGDGLD